MLIDEQPYLQCIKGYTLVDAVMHDHNTLALVLVAEYDLSQPPTDDRELTTRVVVCRMAQEMSARWRVVGSMNGVVQLLGSSAISPHAAFVGVDRSGQVISIDLSGNVTLDGQERNVSDKPNENLHIEQKIPVGPKGPKRGGMRKLRRIGGMVHACSGYRGLARWEKANSWVSLCEDLEFTPQSGVEYGFDDFDAFDNGEFYCVGGEGDVWRFDGQRWTVIDFPSNMYLESVCCGADGFVYIGAQGGTVFKGRGNHWECIHEDTLSLPYKDMVWFNDRVYCTSDYGLWEIVNDEVLSVGVPVEVRVCAGNLSVAGGRLLLAGVQGAALFDGKHWQIVVGHLPFNYRPEDVEDPDFDALAGKPEWMRRR